MRIISGSYKGRILKSPSGKDPVRPTTDRARETLFNILTNKFDLSGKTCLDLFCGTGSLGIEFFSRGGKMIYFVDKIIITLKKNILLLNLNDKCEIFKQDSLFFLKNNLNLCFDFIFADPPYNYNYYDNLLKAVSNYKTIFILEHNDNFKLCNDFEKKLLLYKRIGKTNFSFFDFN